MKSYLKRFYNFTDDKCQAFNPDDRSHSSDRLQPIHCVEYSPHPPSSSISSSSSVTASAVASVAMDYHTVLNQFIEQHFSVFIKHHQQQQSNSMNAPLDPKLVVGFLTILREIVMDFNRVSILLNNDPVDFTVSKRSTTVSAKKQQQQQQKHDNDYSSSVDDVDDEDDTSSGGNNTGKGMKRKSLSSASTTTKKTKKAPTTTTAKTISRTPVRKSKSKKRRLNICSDDDDDGGEDEDDDLEDGDYKG